MRPQSFQEDIYEIETLTEYIVDQWNFVDSHTGRSPGHMTCQSYQTGHSRSSYKSDDCDIQERSQHISYPQSSPYTDIVPGHHM